MLTMLEKVRNYIERLISLYERERQRADSLAEELNSSRETVHALKEQIAELNRQIDNQKLASAFGGSSDSREAKDRMTKLIKEIDRCIALLEA